jgi:hypothetical protein
LLIASGAADEHRVDVLAEAPPADALSVEIIAQLSPTGVKVTSGARTVCEIWLCKEWPAKANFQPTNDVLYPFEPGHLIGALRFRGRANDFRDQQISRGVYTLRYAQQPVDGNHVGTSPTRDFLLLSKAAEDTSPEPLDVEQLTSGSAEAAGTSHPALLSLQRPQGEGNAAPTIRHNDESDWWIVRLTGQAKTGQETRTLPLELVVVGHAAE